MLLGIDIQEVERMKNLVGTDKMQRIFSRRELDYINRKGNTLETLAGLFCAKEAFFKAVGTGINVSKLPDVEILHQHSGQPYYELSADIIKANRLTNCKFTISISHTKTTAVAVCLIMRMTSFLASNN